MRRRVSAAKCLPNEVLCFFSSGRTLFRIAVAVPASAAAAAALARCPSGAPGGGGALLVAGVLYGKLPGSVIGTAVGVDRGREVGDLLAVLAPHVLCIALCPSKPRLAALGGRCC